MPPLLFSCPPGLGGRAPFLTGIAAVLVTLSHGAWAQVTDAERAAARELFKQGDDLQHQGRLAEALDKFERAQQVFAAPTNQLRIAECQAGLGKLVEAAETYRSVARTSLPPGSPAAFQAAIEQANAELPQVEPRVPRVTIQVAPAGLPGAGLQIDGQSVPPALLGTPIPLDPGTHTVVAFGQGYTSAGQDVLLQERDTKIITLALRALPPGPSAPAPALLPPAAPAATATVVYAQPPPTYGGGPPAIAPPEQRPVPTPGEEKKPSSGFLVGLHLGDVLPAGNTPLPGGGTDSLQNASSAGLGYGLDGGFRFAKNWILGATLEHAELDHGANTSNTTMLGASISLVTNPERVSFYFSLGVAARWYSANDAHVATPTYSAADLLLGLGLWIPIGRSVRLLPEITASIGTFSDKSSVSAPGGTTLTTSTDEQGHEFYMLGLAGFYNVDL